MKLRKIYTATLIAFATLSTANSLANESEEAQAFLQQELDAIVRYVNSDTHTPDAKRALAERQIQSNLALGYMTVSSLGLEANKFNAIEFVDFSIQFQRHLLHMYLDRIATFKGDHVEIVSAVYNQNNDTVAIETLGGERGRLFSNTGSSLHKAEVDYHLKKEGDEWQIVRIIIEGVDINANFRAQFESALKRNSPKAIISQLKKGNKEKDANNPFE